MKRPMIWYYPSDVSEDIYRTVVHPEDNISQSNTYSGTEGIAEIVWNSKVHYCVHKTQQLIYLEPDESSLRPHALFL